MVLSKARPGLARPYIPGKGSWGALIGMLVLATFVTFHGADRSIQAPSLALFDAGDIDRTLHLKSEIDHAGA
jgi:hypothetical protein